MSFLCRLVTPPGGTVLDLFMGSGSTGKAAMREGFCFVGIDNKAQYLPVALRRIERERVAPAAGALGRTRMPRERAGAPEAGPASAQRSLFDDGA